MVSRIILLICLLLLSANGYALTASIDRSALALNETLTLQLRSDSRQDMSEIELSALSQDFEIVNQSTQSSINIINGESQSNTTLTLQLKPKRIGTLTIPGFELDGKTSRAGTVTVTEAKTFDNATEDRAVFLEVELDKAEVFVGEQLIYTLRVLYAADLSNASLQPFDLPDVDVEELPERRYQRSIDGRRYSVVERRYALFANEAGELVIPQQELDGVIGGSSRFGFTIERFGQRSQRIRIASKEQSINVKPLPDGQSVSTWLPANQLSLKEEWGNNLSEVRVGEPVLRKIQLSVEGLPAARLPEIKMADIRGLNIYPEKPVLNSENTEQGVVGQRTETLAFIPTEQGNYTLPKLTLNWWDAKNKQFKTAELPERTLTILPAKEGALSRDPIPLSPSDIDIKGSAPLKENGLPENSVQTWWQYLALFSTFAWMLTLVYLWSTRNRVAVTDIKNKDADNPRLRHVYQQLKTACLNNEAAGAKAALEKWLSVRFPGTGNGSIVDKAIKLDSQELSQQVNKLNSSLYGQGVEDGEWNGSDLLALIAELDRKKDNKEEQGLAPLYPKMSY